MSDNTTPAEFDVAAPSTGSPTQVDELSAPNPITGNRPNTPLEEYRWYMGGQAMFFASGGIGFVLGQWIIAFYLREPPEVMGLAMMIMSLPQLIFILFGGLAADRMELRGHLMRMQSLMMIPMLGVAAVIMAGQLTVVILVAINFVGAIFAAFVQPARDSLLSRVTANLEHISIQGWRCPGKAGCRGSPPTLNTSLFNRLSPLPICCSLVRKFSGFSWLWRLPLSDRSV